MQDAGQIKEKILRIVNANGPSLPVRISKELGMSPLFASAFLSELLSNKQLKISNLKVGNSPLYFIAGQESQLENFAEHLGSKEKEAFLLLKEKKFLEDATQQPAIRVALRLIRDFAVPFKKEDRIFWRYFTIPESDFNLEAKPMKVKEKKEEKPKEKVEVKVKKKAVKKKSSTKGDKFFNQVKEFLDKKSIEILDIVGISAGELIFRVNDSGEEKIIVAFNKKRITDLDIVKASRKAEEFGLKYSIFSLGEPLKKLNSFIDAIRNLSEIEKLD
jgi:hypothetical protein